MVVSSCDLILRMDMCFLRLTICTPKLHIDCEELNLNASRESKEAPEFKIQQLLCRDIIIRTFHMVEVGGVL